MDKKDGAISSVLFYYCRGYPRRDREPQMSRFRAYGFTSVLAIDFDEIRPQSVTFHFLH